MESVVSSGRSGRLLFMMPLYFPSQRIFFASALSAIALAGAALVFFQVHAEGAGRLAQGERAISPSSAAPSEGAASAAATSPLVEIHIAASGLTLVRGATVRSVSGDTIIAKTAWNSTDITWTVQTRYGTQFFGSGGEKAALGDLQPGDVVTITGNLVGSISNPLIDARYVRKQKL